MKKLTASKIIKIIKDNNISVEDFAKENYFFTNDFIRNHLSLKLKEQVENYNNWTKESDTERLNYPSQEIEKEFLEFTGIGEWEEISQTGGEGQGDYWDTIKYFKNHDIYIRTIGHYQSHDGVQFYEEYGEEVKPKQKTITVYE
jgi:hypothetical protein